MLRPAFLLLGLMQVPEPPSAPIELRWSAPPECPDRAALLQGIAERRGQPLAPGQVRVDARVTRTGARYTLRLALQAGARRERRALTAEACPPLVDATALLIALAVDAAPAAALPPGVTAAPPSPGSPQAPGDPAPGALAASPGPVGDARAGSEASDAPRSGPGSAEVRGGPGSGAGGGAEVPGVPGSGPGGGAEARGVPGSGPGGGAEAGGVPGTGPGGGAEAGGVPGTGPGGGAEALVESGSGPVGGAEAPARPGLDVALGDPPGAGDAPASRRPGGVVRLHVGPELGAVPGLSAALGLGLGLLWPRLRVELFGTFVAPRRALRPQASLDAWLLAAGVQVCARPGRGALEFPLCAGAELGGMRGVAHGPTIERAALGLWAAGLIGAGVAWRFHPRLALWSALQGLVAVRPSFQVRDPGPAEVLFEPSPVSGRLLVGLELRLGDRR